MARTSAVCAVIGVYGYTVMAVAFVIAVAGVSMETVLSYELVFFPAVMVGTFLAFPLFAVATLVTGVRSRLVGILLGTPAVIFVANVLSGPSAESIFVVLVALVLIYGPIGYLLRGDDVSAERTPAQSDTSIGND